MAELDGMEERVPVPFMAMPVYSSSMNRIYGLRVNLFVQASFFVHVSPDAPAMLVRPSIHSSADPPCCLSVRPSIPLIYRFMDAGRGIGAWAGLAGKGWLIFDHGIAEARFSGLAGKCPCVLHGVMHRMCG